jgi:hypothetical protein
MAKTAAWTRKIDWLLKNQMGKTFKQQKKNDPGFNYTPPNSYQSRGIKNDPGFDRQSTYKGKAMKNGGSTAAWTRKEGKNPTGGLNAKGVASYRAANPGSKLKTAVTTKPSKLKAGSKDAKRRKSFCARMSGMPGPMKDEKGRPTRKALSLKKWNC